MATMDADLAQSIADVMRGFGAPLPSNPDEWVGALFRNPDISNSQITRALTDAPVGSKEYKNQLRSVERWRDTATGRGKPENARKPSSESVDKLTNSQSLRRLVGITPQSVRVTGYMELMYNDTSQKRRYLTGARIELSRNVIQRLIEQAGSDDQKLGEDTVAEILYEYGGSLFPPDSFTAGTDTRLRFIPNGH